MFKLTNTVVQVVQLRARFVCDRSWVQIPTEPTVEKW